MARNLFFCILRVTVVLCISAQALVTPFTVVRADDEPPIPQEISEEAVDPPVESTPPPDSTSTPEPLQTTATPDNPQPPADTPSDESGELVAEATETPEPESYLSEDPSPLFAGLPEDVDLVVVDEDQAVVSLASQQAQEIIAGSDPWYCPGDTQWTVDGTGCVKFTGSTGFDNFQQALDYAADNKTSGTIYVEVGQSFGSISREFGEMNSGIILNIIGGVNLSTGQVTGVSNLKSISLSNLQHGGKLIFSNFKINDQNTAGTAASFTYIENLALENITIIEANTGHALAIDNSAGSLVLSDISIDESGDGDGLRVGSSNHVTLDQITLIEAGNGNGYYLVTNQNVTLRDSSITEKGAGYSLYLSDNSNTHITNSFFQSESDSDAVWMITENNTAWFESDTIRFISPTSPSGFDNLRSAIVFFNNRGKIEFNRNNLFIQKPTDPQTSYKNGIYLTSNAADAGNFSAIGNVLNGGSIGLTSNAVVVENFATSVSILFNWNQICNWTNGFFNNSTSITIDAAHNAYCGATPANSGTNINIRGPVTYLPVATSEDEDGDGVDNVHDTCPTVINPGAAQTADLDGDGLMDACDPQDNRDQDGDGIQNFADSCPLVSNPGAGQTTDTDKDGTPDACDATPNGDTDGDGVDNLTDTCPLSSNPGPAQTTDSDGDSIPDACDDFDNRDSDGDGIQNYADTCPMVSNPGTGQTTDTDSDGKPDACDPTPNGDTDGDGVDNLSDTCPLISNPGSAQMADMDGDLLPDACDDQDNRDTDGDGVQNYTDTCPMNANPGDGQTADRDSDGKPDACDTYDNGDTDGDGVDNQTDTCPLVANPGSGQDADSDGDVIPDACDNTPNGDHDLDHVDDAIDNCLNHWNPLQTDSDHDGTGDACDEIPVPSGSGKNKGTGQASPVEQPASQSDCLSASILDVKGAGQLKLDQLPCGYLATGKPVDASTLPADLPEGLIFESAVRFELNQPGGESTPLPIYTATVLSFEVPDPGIEWQILFWNPDLNGGAGGWQTITGTMDKNTLTALITRTGLYVLARR